VTLNIPPSISLVQPRGHCNKEGTVNVADDAAEVPLLEVLIEAIATLRAAVSLAAPNQGQCPQHP